MLAEIVVHHLAQAKAALAAADETDVDIQLRSAPGAAASAGVGYLYALGENVDHELLIDCDDDAGLVTAALRAGCRKLVFRGSKDDRRRLSQMAARCNASLRGAADRSPPCLVLSPDDDQADIRSRLDAHAESLQDELRG